MDLWPSTLHRNAHTYEGTLVYTSTPPRAHLAVSTQAHHLMHSLTAEPKTRPLLYILCIPTAKHGQYGKLCGAMEECITTDYLCSYRQ